MTTKLTLSIDQNLVKQAKKHLQKEGQSLSGLVEDYFRLLIKIQKNKKSSGSIVNQLTGIAKSTKNPREVIADYLNEKYQ